LIRIGRHYDKGQLMPTQLVKSYISQYCSFKTESDFVASLIHEGSEGEMLLKWFDSKVS